MFKKILDVFIDKLDNAIFWRVLTSSVEMDPLVRFRVEPVMVDCKIKLLVERVCFPITIEGPDREGLQDPATLSSVLFQLLSFEICFLCPCYTT